MDFDLEEMMALIRRCRPKRVYVVRNSWQDVSQSESSNKSGLSYLRFRYLQGSN